MLRNLILSAAAAGLAAGLLTAALQQVTTTPIIIEAERYESSATGDGRDGSAPPDGHVEAAHHDTGAWVPQDGAERTLYTSLATIVTGVGFALALLGAMALTNRRINGPTGLAFGLAGFAALALAPALGLPPELPGSAAADLGARQVWWALTGVATIAGLAGFLLTDNVLLRIGGAVLIALPHIVGAPQPAAFASTAPAELAGHFAAASLAVTAVFWAVLGFLSGTVYERLAQPR